MVDFHTHVLPQLDDGASSVEQSLEMLAALQAQGVTTVVSTSHYYGKQRSPEEFFALREEAFAKIAAQIPSGMEIRLGAEVHFTEESQLTPEVMRPFAIVGTNLIMIELPFYRKWTKKLLDRLSDFVSETGFVPVIAHIERYPSVLAKPSLVNELLEIGCLIQMNAEAFTQKRTKKFAFTLLKHGFVHCLGSDSHDVVSRPPNLLSAKKAMEEAGMVEEFIALQNGMKTLLCGGQVPIYTRPELKKCLFGYK